VKRAVSRILSHPLPGGGDHFSRPAIARRLVHPTRDVGRDGQPRGSATFARTPLPTTRRIHGLAGGGVYPATTVTGRAVRSYRTISPLPKTAPRRSGSVARKHHETSAVSFLWHFPWDRSRWPLATTVP